MLNLTHIIQSAILSFHRLPIILAGAVGGTPTGTAMPGTPRDIPLPLPLPEWLLVALLVFSFLLHILFVNLIVGGSLLTLWAQLKSKKEKGYVHLAREIASTITVNKSMAVVLGVAPLLSINALYTIFFYSANALTARIWMSIVPIVTIAFLLLYWHKYGWSRLESKPGFHLGILISAVVLLLFIPLIFLTNINLMLFPQKWNSISGFFSAMFLANVIPRYFHFLCASVAITGLFLFGYMRRKGYDFAAKFATSDGSQPLKRGDMLRLFYKLALGASLLQLLLGPLNLFTLPWHAVTWKLVYVISAGILLALSAMYLLWKELKGKEENLGRRYYVIIAILSVTVLFMGTGRHIYRAVALKPFEDAVKKKTENYQQQIKKHNPTASISEGSGKTEVKQR